MGFFPHKWQRITTIESTPQTFSLVIYIGHIKDKGMETMKQESKAGNGTWKEGESKKQRQAKEVNG